MLACCQSLHSCKRPGKGDAKQGAGKQGGTGLGAGGKGALLQLPDRMAQHGLEFCRVGAAWVAHVDLVVFAAQPDQILAAVLLHEGLHSNDGIWFAGVWTDV